MGYFLPQNTQFDCAGESFNMVFVAAGGAGTIGQIPVPDELLNREIIAAFVDLTIGQLRNSFAGANSLANGPQYLMCGADGGTYATQAIKFFTGQFPFSAVGTRSSLIVSGAIDMKAALILAISSSSGYVYFEWDNAQSAQNNLYMDDCFLNMRVYYR